MSESAHYFTAVNVLIVKGGKVLLSRRQNKGWGDGLLCIPGGHIQPNELPRAAAVREIKEELGMNISEDDLVYCCTEAKHSSVERTYLSVEFTLETDQEPINNEPHECSELVWVDPHNLPSDVIPNFRNIIENGHLGNQQYLEYTN